MKVEDIIEGLNTYIENKRKELNIQTTGHIVLQKNVKPHATFKAYKEYIYVLWFIKGSKKTEIFKVSIVDKVSEGHEESIVRKMNIELCKNIFEWFNSFIFDYVIKGEYDRNKNE